MLMNGARKKTFSLPLRGALVLSMFLLVLASAGLPLCVSWESARRRGIEASARLADEIAERVVSHIGEFLHIPYIVNRLNSYMLGEGILSVDDEGALEHLFRLQVDILQPLTSIYFGNNRGGLVDSGREAPYDSRYVITTEGGAAGTFRKYAIDKDGRRGKLLAEVPDFDGRTRDWYMRALTSGGAAWSDVYVLFTGQDMVVTASRPVFDRGGDILGVVAVDISMLQLSGFLQTLPLGDEVAFVLDQSGQLTASSTGEKTVVLTEDGKLRRITAGESASPEIRAAAAFAAAREPSRHSACSGRVLIDPGGRYFHVRAVPVRGPGDLDWTVVVAAPESGLSAGYQAGGDWRFLLALSVGLRSEERVPREMDCRPDPEAQGRGGLGRQGRTPCRRAVRMSYYGDGRAVHFVCHGGEETERRCPRAERGGPREERGGTPGPHGKRPGGGAAGGGRESGGGEETVHGGHQP